MKEYQFVFTNDKTFVIENLTPNLCLNIKKFVSLNDISFANSQALGFKVTPGTLVPDVHLFVSLLSANQPNPTVIETDLQYFINKPGPVKIEIENPLFESSYNIAMLYTIEKRVKWSTD